MEKWLKILSIIALILVLVNMVGITNTILLAVVFSIAIELKTLFKWMAMGLGIALFGGNLLGWLCLPCIIYGIFLYAREQWEKNK